MNPEKFFNKQTEHPLKPEKEKATIDQERAAEIMGRDQFLGSEDVKRAFGISSEAPDIPYSAERLEEAKNNGELLVLRVDHAKNAAKVSIENLVKMRKSKGERLFSPDSTDITDEEFSGGEFWAEGMPFIKDESPKLGWRLIKTELLGGTEHLSQELQSALVERATRADLKAALDRQINFWKKIWQDDSEQYISSVNKLPSLDQLEELRDAIPDGAKLPSAVAVIYDQLLYEAKTGKPLYKDMSVATSSIVPAIENEPDRPIDIAFRDPSKGINLHKRMDMRMGRPGPLGDLKPGVPIGHLEI